MLSMLAALALTAGPLADAPLRAPALTMLELPVGQIFPAATGSSSETSSCGFGILAGTTIGAALGLTFIVIGTQSNDGTGPGSDGPGAGLIWGVVGLGALLGALIGGAACSG